MRGSEELTGSMSILTILKSRPIEDLEMIPQDTLSGEIKCRDASQNAIWR